MLTLSPSGLSLFSAETLGDSSVTRHARAPLAVAQPFSEPQNWRPQTRSLRLLHFMVIEVQAQPSSKTSDGGPGAV